MTVMPATLREAAPNAAELRPAELTEVLDCAYELGNMIKRSALADEYAYWKAVVEKDEEARRLAGQLAKAKERFAECERFGRFHPDYHEALDRLYAAQAELEQLESVRRFKSVENELDQLLHEVSLLVARAVSDSVKVPEPDGKAIGGCGNGGACSCGGGGCG